MILATSGSVSTKDFCSMSLWDSGRAYVAMIAGSVDLRLKLNELIDMR